MKIPNVWTLRGEANRSTYFLTGAVLMALKYGIDCGLAWYGFHRPWPISNYISLGWVFHVEGAPAGNVGFYIAMLAAALPFIWIGTAMTVRRLRDAGLPLALALIFMFRPLNWLLIAVLVFLPSRPEARVIPESDKARLLGAVIPRGDTARAVFAVVMTVLISLGFTWLCADVFGSYGWALFVGVPVFTGFLPAWIESLYSPRTKAAISLSMLSMLLYGIGLLAFAAEGAICLLMAAPLGFGLAALGGLIGIAAARSRYPAARRPPVMCATFLLVPLLLASDHLAPEKPPLLSVCSVVVVNAPPERVWQNVISFSKLPPPTEAMFRAGIAYPIDATIYGKGEGAVRHCNFSTGTFVEPIQVWDAPRLLQFSVADQPEPMRELSPYEIHPRHLYGYLRCERGEFRLIPLPGGRTELVGTTWYRNYFWPQAYWQLWTSKIIHTIHMRVLKHIKTLSEANSANKS